MRMRHWHFVCLLLIQGTLNAVQAQAPRSIEDCLPYPTLAQELKQVNDEQSLNQGPTPKVKIQQTTFKGSTGLTGPELKQVAASLKKISWDDGYDWLPEAQERLVYAWQRHGYFQPKLRVEKRELSRNAHQVNFGLMVHVQPGRKYRLAEIHFLNGKQFPADQLRALFPIHAGGVFDTQKIQQGLENLRKAYGDRGYINFTAVPDTGIDQAHGRISLNIDMAEGQQFRLSNVSVVGLDAKLAGQLLERSGLQPGQIFNPANLDDFFTRNKTLLPPAAHPEDDAQRVINEADSTVALRLNFLRFEGCPALKD